MAFILLQVILAFFIFSPDIQASAKSSHLSDAAPRVAGIQQLFGSSSSRPIIQEMTLLDSIWQLNEVHPDLLEEMILRLKQINNTAIIETGSELLTSFFESGNEGRVRANDARCERCKGLISRLKQLFTLTGLEPVKEAFITICELLSTFLGGRGDLWCRGIIELQIPHVYEVLKFYPPPPLNNPDNVSPEEICVFINSCDPNSLSLIWTQSASGSGSRKPHGISAGSQFALEPEQDIELSQFSSQEQREIKVQMSLNSSYEQNLIKVHLSLKEQKNREKSQSGQTIVEAKETRKRRSNGALGKSKNSERVRKSRAEIIENSITLVQLTDIHIEEDYTVGSETNCGMPVCCFYGQGTAGEYGDYNCNIPYKTMEVFLENVNSRDPDIVIFSGDVPPASVWDETELSQRGCSEALVSAINITLPGRIVYPNIGNHETYPTNLFSITRSGPTAPLKTRSFLDWFAELWRPIVHFTEEDNANLVAGGYYSRRVREEPPLRLISFNSNYHYVFNWYNVYNHRNQGVNQGENSKMRTFVESELRKANESNEKVILLGHHPPGSADYLLDCSRWYRELVLQYHDIIVLQPTGHTHVDEFRMIYDDAGFPQSVVYVSPPMSSANTRNPSMRIYYLDNTTYELLDYDHYFMNLTTANYNLSSSPPSNWADLITHLYSARDEYELDDLSPESWDDLLNRFRQNETLLERHRRHQQADARDFLIERCEWTCVERHICRMINVNYDEYQDCLNEVPSPNPPTLPPFSPTIPPLTLPTLRTTQATTPKGPSAATTLEYRFSFVSTILTLFVAHLSLF